jgi:hypothetical protein
VIAAAAFGHRPAVLAALTDQDPAVRAEAVRQALRRGWTTGGELLADAPPVLRRLVLRLLRRSPGSGDAVIDLVRDRYGDREAAVLLPACGTPVVARLLPDLARSTVSWKVLARRHSAAILDWADTGLAAAEPPDWTPFVAAVRACLQHRPERVLDLLERHTRDGLPDVDLAPLAARFPARVVALAAGRLRGAGALRHLPDRVLRHLADLGLDDLLAVDAIRPGFLALLPADRCVEVYDASRPEVPLRWRVEMLPEPARVREARRALALPQVAADEHETRSWRRLLPAAEALPVFDEDVRDPSPYGRERVYAAMLDVARREPAALPQVLERLLRMRNEREAVRRSAFQELRTLIPRFTDAMVPALTAITDAAIDARDLSTAAADTLSALAWAALAHRPAVPRDDDPAARWALGMIARLPIVHYLENPLRPGHEHLVTAVLLKRVAADTGELFALVGLLEKRARHVPELQDLLRRAAQPSSPADVRAEAVERWLDDPRTRPGRVAELLREDPAAVRLTPVWREVSGWSTTLLDEILSAPGAGSAVVAAGPPVHVRRWTTRQQRAYAVALAAVAADTDVEQRARISAVRCLARVPVAGRELLTGFLGASENPIAEAALAALAWTDHPDQALPVLIGHAGGDRASVALPAADRAARFVNPSVLFTILRGVLLAPPSEVRVSGRRAAVRILARYGPPGSPDLLAEVWHAPGAHPDVRAAVVTALRGPEPSPAAWEIFTEAAGSADRAVVSALLGVTPQDLAESGRSRFAKLVATACGVPDPQTAGDAFRRLPQWVRWAPEVSGLIAAALADPARNAPGVHWSAPTFDALVAALLDHPADSGHPPLASVFARLVADDEQDTRPGDPDRDRPARRALTRVVTAASRWARARRAASTVAARDGAVADARVAARWLAARPAFLADGAGLLLVLANAEPVALAEVADLVAERPAVAVLLAGTIEEPHPPADLPATVGALGDRGDLAGGLFAVALVAAAGSVSSWREPWPDVLNRLRDHPHPDVADAAYRREMHR